MDKELIYLACPYRDPDAEIKKKRCAAAHFMAAQLSRQYHVFSPLTHNEKLVDLAQDLPGEHWMQFDLKILAICKRLIVLKLDGWETSKGVQREIEFAKSNKIPIEELEPLTLRT